jgi:hypothetical protein
MYRFTPFVILMKKAQIVEKDKTVLVNKFQEKQCK